MSCFFRFTKKGGFCDVVKAGNYWHKTQIYPIRLLEHYGPDPLPLPDSLGYGWADSRALRKSLALNGWEMAKKARNNKNFETGNRTTKKKVPNG